MSKFASDSLSVIWFVRRSDMDLGPSITRLITSIHSKIEIHCVHFNSSKYPLFLRSDGNISIFVLSPGESG